MGTSHILLSKYEHNQKITILSFNRQKQLNALNNILLADIEQSLLQIENDLEIKVLIIESTIMKAFCAGIDVSYVRSLSNGEAAHFFGKLAHILEKLIHLRVVTIAAVNGYAYGAGADLAISCDIRIGSNSSSFRFPGPQFGIVLGTERLITEIGPSNARYLALTNEVVDAQQALQLGIIHELVEDGIALEAALKRAIRISDMSPYAVKKIKALSSGQETNKNAIETTIQSVRESDFQKRFGRFLGEK